jgi:beta-galactosidase
MATTYHRRIVPTGADIAAVGNAKIGSGSAWQGYYMYAGGSNPAGGPFQESHATGYPNDLPTFDYDFHAAVGSAGQLGDSHALLRQQHAFLAAFGADLAAMPAAFPEVVPSGVDDTSTLRWAVRAGDDTGFVFINWHQPHIPLPTLRDIHLTVELSSRTVEFGVDGVHIAPGTVARWPFGLTIAGARLNWATASALTVLDGRTLVLVADPGLDATVSIGSGAPVTIDGETGGTTEQDGLTVLVIGRRDAHRVWVVEGAHRTLALCDEPLWDEDGLLSVRASAEASLRVWAGGTWERIDVRPAGAFTRSQPVKARELTPGLEPLESYGTFTGRASAPSSDIIAERAAQYQLVDVGTPQDDSRRELAVEWAGDVAQLLVAGVVVADRFWDGTPWLVDLDMFPDATKDAVSLRILPLHRSAAVSLPASATDRRMSTTGSLVSLDAVSLARSTTWHARS